MLEKLKSSSLWKKHWVQFITFVFVRFDHDKCLNQASALTYTTLFAVVPMLTVFLVIISSIKALEPARQQLQQWIYNNFLPKTSIAFDKAFTAFTDNSSNLTVIGILFLFITSVLMLSSIEDAFNRIWRVRRSRWGLIGFMRYWTIISLGPILLGTAFALSSTVASMNFLSSTFGGYELNFTFILSTISFILTCLGFCVLYWTIPNRHVPFRSAFFAGCFSGIVFELIKSLFGFVMSNFTSYQLIYGAFAAVPIFLLWIYTSWIVILFGVQLSYALTAFHADNASKRPPILTLLNILALFYKKQKLGQTVSELEALDALGRGEIGRWPKYLEMLEKQKLIIRTENDQFVLSRNLYEVNLWDFIKELPYPLPRDQDLIPISHEEIWLNNLHPILDQCNDYLAQQLNIPLAMVFEEKSSDKP